MALTGLEIYKLLPKTNCKECGFPTCLAFAMKLAAEGAELSSLPLRHRRGEGRLDAASAPPIRLVTVGGGERALRGRQRGRALPPREDLLTISQASSCGCKSDDRELAAMAEARGRLQVERVGMTLGLDGLAVERPRRRGQVRRGRRRGRAAAPACRSSSMTPTRRPWPRRWREAAGRDAAALRRHGRELAGDGRAGQEVRLPAGVRARPATSAALAELDREARGGRAWRTWCSTRHARASPADWRCSLSFAAWRSRRTSARSAIPSSPSRRHADPARRRWCAPRRHRQVRRLRRPRPLRPGAALSAADAAAEHLHRPAEADPGGAQLYPISEPGPDSPLLVTTNFSLTYFSVAGEVEGSGVPAWLLVADCRGHVRADRLGRRQVRRREDRQDRQGSGIAEQGQPQASSSSRATWPACGELEEELPGWESWSARAKPSTSRLPQDVWSADQEHCRCPKPARSGDGDECTVSSSSGRASR